MDNVDSVGVKKNNVTDFFISFVGQGGELFVIFLKNIFLTIITLGIYTPWAKTNLRKFFVGHIKLNEDRFRFTGTGYELFIGWLILMGGYIVLSIVSSILSYIFLPLTIIITIIYPLGLGLLIYKSKDYLYKKSEYKSIRFGLNYEHLNDFVLFFFLGILAIPFTLGLILPWWTNKLRHITLNDLQWGSMKFQYTGETKDYYVHFIFVVLTLGLYYPWYCSNVTRYVASKTTTNGGKLKFRSSIRGIDYALYHGLLFICLITVVGIVFMPFLMTWFKSVFFANIQLVGEIDLEEVSQEVKVSKEGFWNAAVDYLDIMDSDFDIGL